VTPHGTVQAVAKRLQATTDASRRQQTRPGPDRTLQAGQWRQRFERYFHEFGQLLDRFKAAGGVLVLVRDWEVEEQQDLLREFRAQAKTLQDIVHHFEKVIVGEEAALRAFPEKAE
jgi:hypothetical protein